MLGRSSPVPQSFNLTAPFCKSSLAQSTFDQTGHHQWAWLLSSRRRRGISSCLSISRGGEAWTFCQAWSRTFKLSSQGQGHLLQRQFGPFAKSRWRKAQCSIAIQPTALVIPTLGEGEQQGLIKTSRLSKCQDKNPVMDETRRKREGIRRPVIKRLYLKRFSTEDLSWSSYLAEL